MLVFRTFTYYKMSNLDNRIANADQLLTQDVDKLCSSVGELYSNLSKVSKTRELFLNPVLNVDSLWFDVTLRSNVAFYF